MSNRFWLTSAAALGIATVSGFGIGTFVVTPPRPVSSADTVIEDRTETAQIGVPAPAWLDSAPRTIHCTGCGPTLAERKMAQAEADMPDYSVDAQEWFAQDQSMADDEDAIAQRHPPAPPPARLPANVERFASGEPAPPPIARTTYAPATMPVALSTAAGSLP